MTISCGGPIPSFFSKKERKQDFKYSEIKKNNSLDIKKITNPTTGAFIVKGTTPENGSVISDSKDQETVSVSLDFSQAVPSTVTDRNINLEINKKPIDFSLLKITLNEEKTSLTLNFAVPAGFAEIHLSIKDLEDAHEERLPEFHYYFLKNIQGNESKLAGNSELICGIVGPRSIHCADLDGAANPTYIWRDKQVASKLSSIYESESDLLGIEINNKFLCVLDVNHNVDCFDLKKFEKVESFADQNTLQIATFLNGFCRLTKQGSVYCWGDNSSGQLGQGDNNSYKDPVIPKDLDKGVYAIAATSHGLCALKTFNQGLICWGQVPEGLTKKTKKLGLISVFLPIEIEEFEFMQSIQPQTLTYSYSYLCAESVSKVHRCVGIPEKQNISLSSTDFKYLRVSSRHLCFSNGGGELFCQGENFFQQIVENELKSIDEPLKINAQIQIEDFFISPYYTIARTSTNDFLFWGKSSEDFNLIHEKNEQGIITLKMD